MYVYGKNTVLELLQSDTKIYHIYITRNFKHKTVEHLLKKKRIAFEIKEKSYIDNLVNNNAQGIVAKIDPYQYKSLEYLLKKVKDRQDSFFVILDQITDAHNFASILRVCECVGVDGVIIPKNNSATVTATTYKISSGAVCNVDICVVSNLSNTFKSLKEHGFWIVGSDLATDNDYTSIDYKMNVGLVIGNEETGIRTSTKKHCDFLVKIPMEGKVNSLNASVATGILCYQIYNNRKER